MIELPVDINAKTVESAYRYALDSVERRRNHIFENGMRVAHAHDPKLVLALERASNVLNQIQEGQIGRYKRDPGTVYAHQIDLTEFSIVREAYVALDKGDPLPNFGWIYGAFSRLVGLID